MKMTSKWKAALWVVIGVVVAAVAVGFIMPLSSRPSLPGRASDNMRKVAAALKRYAIDHGDQFPGSLEGLVPKYLPAHERLWETEVDGKPKALWQYFPAHKLNEAPREILLVSPRSPHNHYRFVAYTDGMTGADYEMPAEDRAALFRGLIFILAGVVLVLLAAHFIISKLSRPSQE